MSQVGAVYGQALYDLTKEDSCSQRVLQELTVLKESFEQEPKFLRLLSAPNLSKEERCGILDESFREKVHPYVLNFLKILIAESAGKIINAAISNEPTSLIARTITTAVTVAISKL